MEKYTDDELLEMVYSGDGEIAVEISRRWQAAKIKAEKWDLLDAEIGEVYEDEEDVDGLISIGEAAASAFGYL